MVWDGMEWSVLVWYGIVIVLLVIIVVIVWVVFGPQVRKAFFGILLLLPGFEIALVS